MVKIYPVPDEVKSQSEIRLAVNGQDVALYDAKVLYPPFKFVKKAPYGIFEFTDSVDVEVNVPFELSTVDIRPKSKNIDFTFDKHTVKFTLNEPVKISVEFNGSIENALAIFAYDPEENVPSKDDENVMWFEPGIYNTGDIELTSGQTVYISAGAYIYGNFYTAKNSENIKVMGRGIIDRKHYRKIDKPRSFDICNTKNFVLQDITITDSPGWTCKVQGADNVLIRNVNIFGYQGNTDGVDVCGSRNVEVHDMFIRNWDDGLAVKAFETGDVYNVYFHDCTLWNDFARPIEVGYEYAADEIKNVHYKNIDIIHSLSGYPLIGIHQGDRAHIHDIIFEDIRVEDAPGGQFIDLRIKPSAWNTGDEPGYIENVTFRNIYLNGKPGLDRLPEPSRIEGWSEKSTISNVTFDNLFISGKRISSAEECNMLLLKHCHDIRFLQPQSGENYESPVPIQTFVEITKTELSKNGIYNVSAVVKATNISLSEHATGNFWLEAYPKNECKGLPKNWSYDLKAGESVIYDVEFTLRAGKYFITTQSAYIDVKTDWCQLELCVPVHALCDNSHSVCELKDQAIDFYTMEGIKTGALALGHKDGKLWLAGHVCDLAVKNGKSPELKDNLHYACLDIPTNESLIDIYFTKLASYNNGDVTFILPETGFGETTALVLNENGKLARAPELRNVAELTYVFKNMPKVDNVYHLSVKPFENDRFTFEKNGDGYDFIGAIDFSELGIDELSNDFVLEFSVNAVAPGTDHFDRVPMFHSLKPITCVQMYGRLNFEK